MEPGINLWQLAYYRTLAWGEFHRGFLARASHELRSPLSKVISLQQMILEGLCDSPEEEREFLDQSYGAALKLLEYLDFLTYLSKVEGGHLHPQCALICLGEVLTQVKTLTTMQATNRNLRLVVEMPSTPVQVWADGTWLTQALTLMVEGAIASCQRGTIRLAIAPASTPADDSQTHLWLEDDRPLESWQEPCPLPDTPPSEDDQPLPLSIRHSLALAMVATMGGAITLADPSPNFAHCLQCTLMATPGYQP